MVFGLYLLQMAEFKKARVKVVCLEVLYHPSNFLPSLKKHPVYNSRESKINKFRTLLVHV